jgi:RNA polymerase sigma factor (sigma-70 family)
MADRATTPDRPRMFPVTQWTVILAAGATPSLESAAALERLCQAYWYPLYAFVRRGGHSPPDAQDLTQEFFARLLEHNWIGHAHREKGRFRSFLLMAMKRFLAKEWDQAKTLKRGGHVHMVPLQFDTAETRYSRAASDPSTPEQVFEKQWGLTLLETVLSRLRQDDMQDAKGALFQTLEPCLVGSREVQPYAKLAAKLGMTEGGGKKAVSRLRERYRACLMKAGAGTGVDLGPDSLAGVLRSDVPPPPAPEEIAPPLPSVRHSRMPGPWRHGGRL